MTKKKIQTKELVKLQEKTLEIKEQADTLFDILSRKDLLDDYKFARENITRIINNAFDLLESCSNFAQQSESPRAFEVSGQLLRLISDANKNLLELHKDIQNISEKDVNSKMLSIESTSVPLIESSKTNGFIGSTSDLLKRL